MKRVRLFHWKKDEAGEIIAVLRAGGYGVDYPGPRGNGRFSVEAAIHAFIIDLSRMPSHGRYIAAELRARKSAREIPIVFVDGEPEKVARVRSEIPDATFTTHAKLVAALKRVKPVTNPIQPSRMMASTRSNA